MFHLLVCGGLEFKDEGLMGTVLDFFHQKHPELRILTHGYEGADLMARQWAIDHGAEHHTYRPLWRRDGKKAVQVRNELIFERGKPDLVLAFPGKQGVEKVVASADKRKIPVQRVG